MTYHVFFQVQQSFVFLENHFLQNQFFFLFCEHCFCFIHNYVIINSHSKCVVCICQNCFYVSIFLKTLNRTHDKLEIDFDVIEKKLFCVFSKINRFRKQIKFVKFWIVQKIQCVTIELNNDNDETKSEEISFAFAFVSLFQLIENLFNDFWKMFFVDKIFSKTFDNSQNSR